MIRCLGLSILTYYADGSEWGLHAYTFNIKLEGKCDFSSTGNNNVWTGVYESLAAIFNFVRLFYH